MKPGFYPSAHLLAPLTRSPIEPEARRASALLTIAALGLLFAIGAVGCGLPSQSDGGSDAATSTLWATPVPLLAEGSAAMAAPPARLLSPLTRSPIEPEARRASALFPAAGPPDELPAAAATPARRARTYVVQPGDTLFGIAHEHDDRPPMAQRPAPVPSPMPVEPTAEPSSVAITPWPEVEQLFDKPLGRRLTATPVASRALLSPMSHEWQKMNNCAPATLAMGLSYYGYGLTQFDLAPVLKGGNQDKNVSPEEIVAYLHEIGLGGRVRVNGDIETLQRLVANGVPVMVEQWLDRPDEELTGHYRLVRGYDREAEVIIVNDSYSGPELRLPYAEFQRLWRAFNRLYIPIYRPEQEPLVREIIGDGWDDKAMYRRALAAAQQEVQEIGDLYAWFNLGDDYLGLRQDKEAVVAFERALAFGLPPRMLWYRFGPFEAYNRTGQYQKTLELAAPLVAAVAGLEEVHYQQGVAYQGLGQTDKAIAAYQRALQYNPGFQLAQEALIGLQVVPELIAHGRYDHPWLGISGYSITPRLAGELGLPAERGVLIGEVDAGGPAARAGLRGGSRQVVIGGTPMLTGGDLVITIDDRPVRAMEDIIGYLEEERKVGDVVRLIVLRDGVEREIEVRLAARP